MLPRSVLLVPLIALALVLPVSAQPAAPPPPALYDVQIRYQIEANRNERVAQYFEMMRDLKRAGFVRDPNAEIDDNEPENSRHNRLEGIVAPDRVPVLLKQRHVRTLRLVPGEKKLPGADELVRVHLELVAGLPADRQRALYEQARDVLASLKFQEGSGYDHRHYSRIVGAIPVKNLDALLADLRRHPQAWRLLSKTLLTDVRAFRGGQQILEEVVTDWYGHKDGKKLVAETIGAWRFSPAARMLIQSLPADVVNEPDSPVLQEQLLAHLLRSPDATDLLAQLLAKVYADPAAPDLVDRMLKRVNAQAAGGGMPILFRGSATIRVIEVLPEMPLPPLRLIQPPLPVELQKFTPDTIELLADPAQADRFFRFELILALTPSVDEREDFLRKLEGVTGLAIEGRLGPVVTIVATPAVANRLAALDEIAVIRLPRYPQSLPPVPQAARKPLPLQETGVASLHAIGHKGQGSVVAILDADFRGWEVMVKEKKLPMDTKLVDLTRERNRRMEPDPFPGDPQQLGIGTRYALTLAAVAPEVELLLVRIDPGSPYMVQNVARAINGEGYRSLGLTQRLLGLGLERGVLDRRKQALLEERKQAFADRVIVEEEDKKRPEYQQLEALKRSQDDINLWLREKKREEYRDRQKQYDKDELDYDARVQLYFRLHREFNDLKRVRVAVSSLVWTEGHPVDGSSPLSRYFDDRPFRAALWFQAGGDARGQAWTGLFRDADANGAMEFAGPETPLPKGHWSHEYNFLKWQPSDGPEALDLPANVKVRLVLQWREAHDPKYLLSGEDRYRYPLANLRLVFAHQLDPAGKLQPADDFQVLVESAGPPQRLHAQPNAATYEQVLEVRVTKPGRYAVRIEGTMPRSIAPRGTPLLPDARTFGELKPRLFVQTLFGPGRVLPHTYWTDAGSLGMPADARQVLAVGAIDRKRERQPYGSRGPAQGMELLVKPDLLAYDEMDGVIFGSGQAAAFAAGMAAVTLNSNAPVRNWMKEMGLQPGDAIRVPRKEAR